jgi:hypothetical protein
MKLISRRKEYGDNYTISELSVNGVYECFLLEDTVRPKGVKIFGNTAVPAGTYNVVINFSNHFQKLLPELLNVPMFEGIRIHPGNTDVDTEGCLLVGTTWGGGDFIGNSVVAFNHLFPQLQAAIAAGESVTIEIQDTK